MVDNGRYGNVNFGAVISPKQRKFTIILVLLHLFGANCVYALLLHQIRFWINCKQSMLWCVETSKAKIILEDIIKHFIIKPSDMHPSAISSTRLKPFLRQPNVADFLNLYPLSWWKPWIFHLLNVYWAQTSKTHCTSFYRLSKKCTSFYQIGRCAESLLF